MGKKGSTQASRFGIGEWFGVPFSEATRAERLAFAKFTPDKKKRMASTKWAQLRQLEQTPEGELTKAQRRRLSELKAMADEELRTNMRCPFKPDGAGSPTCTKDGGVCSLRLYEQGNDNRAVPIRGIEGSLRITCPVRFQEAGLPIKWVGDVLLDDSKPMSVGEVGFLESSDSLDSAGGDDVGRLDMVLLTTTQQGSMKDWVPVEIQAVYFSGPEMKKEFEAISADIDSGGDGFIWPTVIRRPDYRSSGPKRLMPQLQIKVPTLRRWGKKMAVVVDEAFFRSLGDMDEASHASNADILWFQVRLVLDAETKRFKLRRGSIAMTTLEEAVIGLTGGTPVSKPEFESRILAKLGGP